MTPNSGEAQPAELGNPGKRTTFCGRPRFILGLGLHGFSFRRASQPAAHVESGRTRPRAELPARLLEERCGRETRQRHESYSR